MGETHKDEIKKLPKETFSEKETLKSPPRKHMGLPHEAYEAIPGEEYEPYVSSSSKMDEMTPLTLILGVVMAALFGVAMVYVGLKIGMTISASVPAAVISMGILKGIFKKGTILENNLVQTIASAGESLAAGVIFTIPAAFLWPEFAQTADTFSLFRLFMIAGIGGVLGILLMIPLRKYLIVQEHGKLKYPEGTACAEVLVAGDIGGNPAKTVFMGIFIGGIFKFSQQLLKLWKDIVSWEIPGIRNLVFAGESSPILLGVGYIVGLEVAAYMLAGGLMAWFVLIPLITYIGGALATPVLPAQELISTMDAHEIWSNYIRYMGAGAVAFGGMVSLIKSLPTIWESFKSALSQITQQATGEAENQPRIKRTAKDLPIKWILGISALLIIAIILTRNVSDNIGYGIVGAVMVFIFGFFFVTVSSRIVGLVGSSSNPVSGMTIATLIVSTLIFKALGFTGIEGMVTSLVVGAFVCIAMGMAGDISQDLKTGFLLGATPWKQQIGQIIGVAASSFFVVWMVLYLKPFLTGGGENALRAPQANLMAILIRGIMEGNLPWILILTGGFIALCVELLGAPSLPFAVGLYLPLELSTPIMVGGLLSWLTGKIY
ncbi:MAG: OPT family oligopeptide transporter, partial [Vulcanimicrobiota bacterium]